MGSENARWNSYWNGPIGRAISSAIEKNCLDNMVKRAVTDFLLVNDSPWESNPIEELEMFLVQLTATIEDLNYYLTEWFWDSI